ncbi:MAG: RNA polymerase-associated protein rapA, partial [Pseudomonadota bacterium]
MVSGQFIQFRNLDFVDEERTCYTQTGAAYDCSRYTGDMAALHMSNGLQKAEENEEFYSLFFSKPFGDSQEHRWNNITIAEEGGGYWNRFDVEYSFTDTVIGSAEWNHYWGDENTLFGQFDEASNLQFGVKWIFE